ncbi:MAG: site-specific DNA-methyltransferase [Anaerolineaceae bacterium]|nr:site-specific DNA-methyltransferase [Anaerolineaceae bacterium]
MNYQLFNEDFLSGVNRLTDASIDLVIADPPYCLGKDYGNDSDMMEPDEYLKWTQAWITAVIPKIKLTGSLYIFTTWQFSPEIFSFLKKHLTMINEIVWDRKVPSMGGTTRRFTSVHDTIGFFTKSKQYYFDLDAVRIPYDPETKKKRTRSIFVGKKWLEMGYNPKDVWSVARLHRIHREREAHPTQKPLEIIERMIKASCPGNGTVLDPFAGSGTTIEASIKHNRECIAFELNTHYCELIQNRIEHMPNESQLNFLSKLENL